MHTANIYSDLPRVTSALLTEPWLILPAYHASMVEQLIAFRSNPDQGKYGVAAPPREDRRKSPGYVNSITTYDEPSGLAMIDVEGVIGKKLGLLDTLCGGFDLNTLEDALMRLQDIKPTAVQLYIDTPGGTVTGVAEAAAMVAEFSHTVAPVHAYTDMMCCSAGEWIASGASSRAAAPSALLGSIGVYNAMFDQTARYAEDGIKVHLATSGPLKGAGYPGTAPSAAQLTALQTEVDRIAEEFFSVMKSKWKGLDRKVHFAGGTFRANSPGGAALVDAIVPNRGAHMVAMASRYARRRAERV